MHCAMNQGNIFASIPAHLPDELFEILIQHKGVKIERIVSRGHASPETGWYDQRLNEWVLVLQGAATIHIADGGEVYLDAGSYLNLPAHTRHRVSCTDPNTDTVWLAVHYP